VARADARNVVVDREDAEPGELAVPAMNSSPTFHMPAGSAVTDIAGSAGSPLVSSST
jgi:hypothetical protein